MRSFNSFRPWLVAGLLLGPCWLSPQRALAEESPSPARALFAEGRQLAAAGNYSAACPKFEESLRLEPGVGTQFNLADCWEHIGRTASAQALFIGAAASAKASGQTDREQVLRERAAALEPRLTRLVVETADTDPRLVIKRDELPLEPATLGKALPLDPGVYELSAKAPGKKPWTKKIILDAASKVVTVEVPQLESIEISPVTVAAVAAAPVAKPEPKPAPASGHRSSAFDYKVMAIGGFGLASLGVGTYFAFNYKSNNDEAKQICPDSTDCTREEIAAHDAKVDKAQTSRTWAYVGLGVGTAALGGAVALYFLQASSKSEQALQALPMVGERGELGASLVGSF